MNLRFTIGRKIGTGFGILIFLTLLAFALTTATLKESRDINYKITNLYTPSVDRLQQLNLLVVRSKTLLTSWVNIQKDSEDKGKLKKLIYDEYPELKKQIAALAVEWNAENQNNILTVFSLIEKLFEEHKEVMKQLNSFDSYEDASLIFEIKPQIDDEDGEINQGTRQTLKQLDELITHQYDNARSKSDEMLKSFKLLQTVVIGLGIALPVGGILIALFTVRTIVRPIHELKRILFSMGKGVLPKDKIKDRNDEIGEMSVALNGLVDGFKLTTEFANEVGAGNFESFYKPLSDEDTLGYALLKMRTDLRENERVLEQKVVERTEEVVRQKQEIEGQNEKLEVLYKHVTDSIRYAKRLQDAILPPDSLMKKLLPKSFVLYKPKDIVSGDFYWIHEKDGKVLFSAVDCTGHGVPGAFMSLVGYNILKHVMNSINKEHLHPAAILDELNLGVSETLHHGSDEATAKDGMDLSFCTIDFKTLELEYAGAFNPLYIVRDGALQQIKANKFPIGLFMGEQKQKFTNHKIQLQKGDTVYIFSDGYADQFGGPNGKKFMVNNFRNLLLSASLEPIEKQKAILDQTIEEWKGELEQVDDILVMGLYIG